MRPVLVSRGPFLRPERDGRRSSSSSAVAGAAVAFSSSVLSTRRTNQNCGKRSVTVSMAKHQRNGTAGQPVPSFMDDEELKAAKRSVEVDTVVHALETICLQNYMTKFEAAAFLFIDQNREPAFTEAVWEELEKQNPEFFLAYKTSLALKDQITKFNLLLVCQRDAMSGALQAGVASGPLPNVDQTRSNQSNQQVDMLPPASGMPEILSDDQSVMHAANNGDVLRAPVIDTSTRMQQEMGNANFGMPTQMHHLLANVVAPNNGVVCAPGLDVSARMADGTTNPAVHGLVQFQESPSPSFDAMLPPYDHPDQNRTMFPMPTDSVQDMLDQFATLPDPRGFFNDDVYNFDLTGDFHGSYNYNAMGSSHQF